MRRRGSSSDLPDAKRIRLGSTGRHEQRRCVEVAAQLFCSVLEDGMVTARESSMLKSMLVMLEHKYTLVAVLETEFEGWSKEEVRQNMRHPLPGHECRIDYKWLKKSRFMQEVEKELSSRGYPLSNETLYTLWSARVEVRPATRVFIPAECNLQQRFHKIESASDLAWFLLVTLLVCLHRLAKGICSFEEVYWRLQILLALEHVPYLGSLIEALGTGMSLLFDMDRAGEKWLPWQLYVEAPSAFVDLLQLAVLGPVLTTPLLVVCKIGWAMLQAHLWSELAEGFLGKVEVYLLEASVTRDAAIRRWAPVLRQLREGAEGSGASLTSRALAPRP